MIELSLTLKQARKLLLLLDAGLAGIGPDLPEVRAELNRGLLLADVHRDSLPPWRKVIAQRGQGIDRIETLECGHTYMLRRTGMWIEKHAKKRRCARCAP